MLAQRGAAVATYGYLGAQLDRVTGLLYVNGRYYDPVTGRYLTPGGGWTVTWNQRVAFDNHRIWW